MNADEMVLHSSIMERLLKMIYGLTEFISKKAVIALLQIIWSTALIVFRICESVQVVSMKKSLLLSESESVRLNSLDANKEWYSEKGLTDQSEKKSINTARNSFSKIKELRFEKANKVIIGNLNINSTRNKFEQLKGTVLKYIDILVVTETKLDKTFLESLFLIDGFSKSYRLDRHKNGGRDWFSYATQFQVKY